VSTAAPLSSSADIQLQIEGMTCASCVSRVEKALCKVPGVAGATVNLATEQATVHLQSALPVSRLLAAVDKAGYSGKLVEANGTAPPLQLPAWWPVALGAALSLPLMAPMLLQLWGIDWSRLRPARLACSGLGIPAPVIARRYVQLADNRHQIRLQRTADRSKL